MSEQAKLTIKTIDLKKVPKGNHRPTKVVAYVKRQRGWRDRSMNSRTVIH